MSDVGVASASECSSADDCLKVGEEYLAVTFAGAERALVPLERAIALDPGNPRGHKDLASAYVHFFGAVRDMNSHLTEEQCCRAEAACQAALSLVPNDPEALLLLGQILNLEVAWGYRADDRAVESLRRAIELKPDWAQAYSELCSAYRLRNRYEEAVAAFDRETALTAENQPPVEPASGPIHIDTSDPLGMKTWKSSEWSELLSVGEICTKMGQYDRALVYLHRAESVVPGDVLSHSLVGKTYLKLGDIESAMREQEALSEICKSKDRFLVTECERYAKGLRDAIEQTPKK